MNDLPCGKCDNFDPILGSGRKKTAHGWCAKKSVYHHAEEPGQVFPAGVKRAAPGALAQPYIVTWENVETVCPDAKETDRDLCEDKRQAERGDNFDESGVPILQ